MSALLLSLAIPTPSHAEPRTPACTVYAEAEAWDWPAQSTCGKLLPPPTPSTPEAAATAAPAIECPISCRLLDPAPAVAPQSAGDEDEVVQVPQLCGDDATLCIAPRANAVSRERDLDLSLFRKPDQEGTAPPTPPPTPSHKPGLTHVFDWVKALNTCRTQTAAAIPRPEKPRKNEFEGSESFSERQAAYTSCQIEREAEITTRQARIEPAIEEASFYAIIRASNIGRYDADEGCFFPGVTARVELDDFKSKDAVYLNHYATTSPINDPKRRLIPRDSELRVDLTSQTIATATLDPDSDRTVLLLTSHPVCVDAETGREYREQSELNGISDFGIQAEVRLNFRFEVSPDPANPREMVAWPVWEIDGDFVYRNDPPGTVLKVEPGRKAPVDDEASSSRINLSGGDGCATASGTAPASGVAVLLGMLGLVGLRRRR